MVVSFWAAVGVLLIYAGRIRLAALAAPLAWILVEYAAHRWAMHGLARRWPRLYQKAHGVHHRFPDDPSHFTVPIPVVGLAAALLSLVLPLSFVGGVLVCLAAYDLVHLGCHGLGPIARIVPASFAARHAAHHRNPRVAFGVSSPVADTLFGTLS